MACLGLGLSFQGLGEDTEAIKWVIKSLELEIENTAGLYSLVKLSHELESYQEAELYLSRYLERHPLHRDFGYTLAGIYFQQEKYDEAKGLLGDLQQHYGASEQVTALLRKINNRENNSRQEIS